MVAEVARAFSKGVLPFHPKMEAHELSPNRSLFFDFLSDRITTSNPGPKIYLKVFSQANLPWGLCRYKEAIHCLHVFFSFRFCKFSRGKQLGIRGYLKGSKFAYKSKVEIHDGI